MAVSVVMPALELAQETGKILSWIKKEGDSISKGEPLVEIETDKITFEVEAPADGVLAGVRSAEGEDVPVGRTIAWIVAPGEAPPAEEAAAATAAVVEQARHAQPSTAAAPPKAPEPAVSGAITAKVSPKAKRLAKAPAPAVAPPVAPAVSAAGGPAPLSAIARLMAERTTQSWTTAPHFFLIRDVDAGGLLETRERIGRDTVTHTDLLVALTARTLLKHPKLNAHWTGQAIEFNPTVSISVAVAVSDGVVGAVIPNAASLSISGIAALRAELADRARSGKLRPQDVSGGTFTISNLGMYGVDAFNAIITPPQAAILAVGRIADRVVPVDGKPGIRPILTLSLSCDHRVVDGAQAALFLNDLAEAIAQPGKLL